MPEKLKLYITADVILLEAAKNFASQFDVSKVFPSKWSMELYLTFAFFGRRNLIFIREK